MSIETVMTVICGMIIGSFITAIIFALATIRRGR